MKTYSLIIALCFASLLSFSQVVGNYTFTLNGDTEPLTLKLEKRNFTYNFKTSDVLNIKLSEFSSDMEKTYIKIVSDNGKDVQLSSFDANNIDSNNYKVNLAFVKLEKYFNPVNDKVFSLVVMNSTARQELLKFRILNR